MQAAPTLCGVGGRPEVASFLEVYRLAGLPYQLIDLSPILLRLSRIEPVPVHAVALALGTATTRSVEATDAPAPYCRGLTRIAGAFRRGGTAWGRLESVSRFHEVVP